MKYEAYRYIWPPRPEYKIPEADLDNYDNGEWIYQPKFNGSCTPAFTNGDALYVYNRHKEPLRNLGVNKIDFRKLATTNKWFVYVGEFLNKGQIGEHGEKERDKYVIFDCLVYDGNYLVGWTVEQRLELLEDVFPSQRMMMRGNGNLEMYEHMLLTDIEGVYRAATYETGLGFMRPMYQDIIKTDLYEGLVLKKKSGRLEHGFNERNNVSWQLKCRKENKLYHF